MATQIEHIEGFESILDPRAREVVLETCRTIQGAFPEAEFRVDSNPEYRGAIIDAYTDADDVYGLLHLVNDRLVDLLVEEDISVRVVPLSRLWLRSLATGSHA